MTLSSDTNACALRSLLSFRLTSELRKGFLKSGSDQVTSRTRPLLLLDVDGVISLFGFGAAGPPGVPAVVDGIPHWLSSAAAGHVARLRSAFECVWCTGWEDRANDHLPHLLGIGPFPYLEFGPSERHWKLDSIDAFAGERRAVAWIDDDLTDECEQWAAERPGPTLLVRTEPHLGMTDAHVERLLAWEASLPPSTPT